MESSTGVVAPLPSQSPSSLVLQQHGSVLEHNKIINAHVKQAQWQRALAVLTDLQEDRLEPSVVTYNTAISACVQGVQWDLALAFLNVLQQQRLADVITFSTTLSSLEAASLWSQAVALLVSMVAAKVSRNSVTYNATISACARSGSANLASHGQ